MMIYDLKFLILFFSFSFLDFSFSLFPSPNVRFA